MFAEALARVRAAFTRVLASAVAASLAYWLAHVLLGQPRPIFAAITAIVCLAPGIVSHYQQGINLLIGVSIGIMIGELVFLIPYDLGELSVAGAVFSAMLVASAFGTTPLVPIQAGTSALLVLLMGPQYAGIARYLDVLIGVLVGVAFAFVFFRHRMNRRQ